MLNIVIPMVGGSNRYAESFYETPKPLADIFGHPVIEYVTQNIRPKCEHRFIYVCQEDHIEQDSKRNNTRLRDYIYRCNYRRRCLHGAPCGGIHR